VISSDPTSRITVGPLLAVIVERVNRYFLAFVRLYSLALLHPTNVSINMAEARRKQDQVLGGPLANAARPSTDDRAGALRGPTPIRVGRRFWLVVGALVIVAVFAALIITTVSAASDNARITRMKDHGMGVALTVAYCTGNLSGSGTNIASYSCVGDYSVDGVKYRELVAGMTTYYATGTTVHGIVDPSKHSTVELAAALRKSNASVKSYLASGILLLTLIALTWGFARVLRPKTTTVDVTS